MQFDPNRPIWLQVKTALQTDIVTGKDRPATSFPGEGIWQ